MVKIHKIKITFEPIIIFKINGKPLTIRASEILQIIINNGSELNISELANKANISRGQTIYRYVKLFKKYGLIDIIKYKKKVGSPVFIKLKDELYPQNNTQDKKEAGK